MPAAREGYAGKKRENNGSGVGTVVTSASLLA